MYKTGLGQKDTKTNEKKSSNLNVEEDTRYEKNKIYLSSDISI